MSAGLPFHLSQAEWNALLMGALGVGGLSILKPELARNIVQRGLRGVGNRFRLPGRGSGGIYVGDVYISDAARSGHCGIQGTTGTGKTVALKHILFQDLARGHGALIIDPKGDRELYLEVREYCRLIGRESDLHLLSATRPDESVRWNPCRLGNSSELQSKWFNSGVYQEPFYAKACELALLQSFNALLSDRPQGFTLADLVAQLRRQAGKAKNDHMQGLSLELENFGDGEWGPLLCSPPPKTAPQGLREVSLLEVTRKNEILFVDLPTEAKKVQSARIGKLLLQELMLISGLRKYYPAIRGPQPFSVFVDEFDAFATEEFVTFLNKGRSSKFMIHIAHQTLSDLDRVSPTYKDQVLGNLNVFLTFRLNVPADAEEMAQLIGTRQVTKQTLQSEHGFYTGRSSNRETQEFKIHPDTIKELRTGECIAMIKNERAVRKVKVPLGWRPELRKLGFPVERDAWKVPSNRFHPKEDEA